MICLSRAAGRAPRRPHLGFFCGSGAVSVNRGGSGKILKWPASFPFVLVNDPLTLSSPSKAETPTSPLGLGPRYSLTGVSSRWLPLPFHPGERLFPGLRQPRERVAASKQSPLEFPGPQRAWPQPLRRAFQKSEKLSAFCLHPWLRLFSLFQPLRWEV